MSLGGPTTGVSRAEVINMTMDDSTLSRAIVEGKLATTDEVAACAEEVKRLQDEGKSVTLAQVLVDHGHVTQSQINRLSEDSRGDSMYKPAQQIPGFQILGRLGQIGGKN